MELVDRGGGVWTVSTELRLGPGFWLPVCSTVLRGPSGLIVVSPVAFDDASASAIDALGPVERIVAPNRLHHLFAAAAKARWPAARLLGAPGLASKRPDLPIDGDLLAEGIPGGEVALVEIEGAPAVSEVVLVHQPSATAIVTDLAFHVTRPRGALTPWILRMMGAHGHVAQSRAWRWAFVEDRAAFLRSGHELLARAFDRVVFAHGDPLLAGGKDALREALAQRVLPGRPAHRAGVTTGAAGLTGRRR